jgi:hypothetical protein
VPRLTSELVLALVADRLRAAGLAVDLQRTGRATYLGHGQWRVVYRTGEWLVQETDYAVVTANQQARDLEAALSPGR